MKIQNLFTSGKMNKDLDERLIPQGEYRDALNVKVANSNGSDVGAIENALSNEAKSSLELGSNAVCVGSVSDDEDRVIYWFVKSDNGCYICYYDQKDETTGFVMSDTRLLTNENPEDNVLNFNESHLIQANILTDADNLKKFIYFTDGLNPPRRINVATAKGYEVNGFTDEDINVIVKPPLHCPEIEFEKTNEDQNNIEEKFILFAYRYVYEDGELSAISPFSEVGFSAKTFDYDFIGATNRAMVNRFNSLSVKYNTGSSLVKSIDVVFKESGNNNIYLAASIDKKEQKILDNTQQKYTFTNNSVYKVLPEDEIFRLYDNVPLNAKTQDIINNRLVYGNYTENYNLIDNDGGKLDVDIVAGSESFLNFSNNGVKSVKSNVDYEIGVVYLDDYGRSTTVLTSDNNSTFISQKNSINQNTLTATIKNLAPKFAKYYRFFVKQSKLMDYHIISPIVMYDDGDYTYIKLEGDDKNKVSENDYVILKADNNGVKSNVIKAKVLEAKAQDKDFLEESGYTGPREQDAGYYLKLSATGGEFLSTVYNTFRFSDFDNNKDDYRTNFTGMSTKYYEGPFFNLFEENHESGLTVSGTYTGSTDRRIEIEIDSTGATDTFRWRAWNKAFSNKPTTYSGSGISCSTSPIALENGISVAFGVTTGHTFGSRWTINAKSDLSVHITPDDEENRAITVFKGLNTGSDEEITSGTRFKINYEESVKKPQISVSFGGVEDGLQVNTTVNSRNAYANIEEWYWEEGKDQLIEAGFTHNNISFRRGQYTSDTETTNTFNITGSTSDSLAMIITGTQSQDPGVSRNANARLNIDVFKHQSVDGTQIVFETEPSVNTADVFYEVPGTYSIDDCGYHRGLGEDDIDQSFGKNAFIKLNFSNVFCFGNGFESYRINDGFVSTALSANNRPLTYIDNYRQNNRNVSVTYSDVYEQSTNYNGLNEFNLSKVNYVDLDDEYGDIQRIHSRDTNLIVFQENKVSQLLYNKSVIFNADGTGNVSQNLNVFGQQLPYNGEYGISNSAHSFSTWGSRMYFADERRGSIMRLSQDGLTEVSQYGMRDWFRDNLDAKNDKVTIGGYDPFNGQYVVSIKDPVVQWREDEFVCEEASCDLKGKIFTTPPTTTTTTTSTTSTTSTTTTSTTTTTTAAPSNCYATQLLFSPLTTCEGQQGVYYINFDNFCTATLLYSDSSCTTLAQNGYYTTTPGTQEYRFWDGTQFTTNCANC